ncbi:hypothetical protein VARIO8X_100002 [Burkholderiales bacterium 8X]|nr:hypothetical protein VARIO8X_100002 [Burkholderiales bacterium 8X]
MDLQPPGPGREPNRPERRPHHLHLRPLRQPHPRPQRARPRDPGELRRSQPHRHLNTPRRITDEQGQVVWQWAYSAFGDDKPTQAANRFADAEVAPNAGMTNVAALEYNKRYDGQYFDVESGLSYNYFRSYDPRTGRYSQSDPIGLNGDWNRFGYVGANPLTFGDSFGLDRSNYFNIANGRSLLNGPTNGNWGGKCWSGGQYSCAGSPMGSEAPVDSGDACYRRHDECYVACGSSGACRSTCNKNLVDELKALPDDPRKWLQPPVAGTERDSRDFKDSALNFFRGK